MNILKPLYHIAILFSGAISAFAGSPDRDDCYKINCNAGKNSKSTSSNGAIVANYNSRSDYTRCGLTGIDFTVNCDSKLSAFLNLGNCVIQKILPKKQCPPIGIGKRYYPADQNYMDIGDIPKGCKKEYKEKHAKVMNAVNDGKKGKFCG